MQASPGSDSRQERLMQARLIFRNFLFPFQRTCCILLDIFIRHNAPSFADARQGRRLLLAATLYSRICAGIGLHVSTRSPEMIGLREPDSTACREGRPRRLAGLLPLSIMPQAGVMRPVP